MVEGRNAKGQFVKGHVANPGGRPKAKPGFREMLRDAVTSVKWKKIVNKAIEQAIAGDKDARNFIVNRIIGKEVDTVDMHVTGSMSLDVWLELAAKRMSQAEEVLCEG